MVILKMRLIELHFVLAIDGLTSVHILSVNISDNNFNI